MINTHTKPTNRKTTLRISPEVRDQLWMMKRELGYAKMEDVVTHLLSNQRVAA